MPIGVLKLFTSPHKKDLRALRNILGFIPGNYSLYRLALRHKSMAIDTHKKGVKNSNERLEFLGDATSVIAVISTTVLLRGIFTFDIIMSLNIQY